MAKLINNIIYITGMSVFTISLLSFIVSMFCLAACVVFFICVSVYGAYGWQPWIGQLTTYVAKFWFCSFVLIAFESGLSSFLSFEYIPLNKIIKTVDVQQKQIQIVEVGTGGRWPVI